jgi:hypothetical protein
MEEAFAPQTYHIASNRECAGYFVVAPVLGRQEDYLGAQDLEVWQRIFARASFQNLSLLP